jgi:carboxyl-terminal processing protease
MYVRRVTIWIGVAWLALGSVSATVATANDAPTLSEEQIRLNVESFDAVWTTIRDRHWETEIAGLDWDALRDELRPRVEQATTMDTARAPIEEMIQRLGLSHYGLIPAEVYDELGGPAGMGALDGTSGIDLRVVEDQVLVTSVADDSPADRAGVQPGWILVEVDGERLAPVLAKVAERFGGTLYEPMALAGAALGRLAGPVGAARTLTLVDGAGATVEATLELVAQRGNKIEVGFMPPLYAWIDHRRIEGTVGYIAFNLFIDPARLMRDFNEAMESFLDAEGLILDLRGNPGGLPMMAMGMAGWLIEEKNLRLGTLITRNNELKVIVFPRPQVYAGPVAVLVDGLSGSCSEILSAGLQDLGRARIFGTRTAGAVLPSAIERLPNGDGFQYAFANYVSADDQVLEGVGVIPDVVVAPDRPTLLEGRDPVLEAAVSWIREQNETQSNQAGGIGS